MLGLSLNALNLFACPRLCSFSRFRFFMVHFFFLTTTGFSLLLASIFCLNRSTGFYTAFFPPRSGYYIIRIFFSAPSMTKSSPRELLFPIFHQNNTRFHALNPPRAKMLQQQQLCCASFFDLLVFWTGFFCTTAAKTLIDYACQLACAFE